jgi:hypothetical protein
LDPLGLNEAAYIKPEFSGDIPCFGVDEELNTYQPQTVAGGSGKKPPVAALAMRYFPRLTAQAGVFTVTHKEQVPVDDAHAGKFVGKLIVPAAAKDRLRRELRLLGVTRFALFPDLDSVAATATEAAR